MIDIINGSCLIELEKFEDNTFDALITDPPYSSGGSNLSARQRTTAQKYATEKSKDIAVRYPNFSGDNKDQRSWTRWTAEWLELARTKCKIGAPIVMFIDWRQLPSLTDAMQWADWTWRGIAVWDKKHSHPQRGRFRQDGEFILWGSNGDMPLTRQAPIIPGVLQYQNVAVGPKRFHQTQKPLELMKEIVKICEPGGHILDPFAGSGTTLIAADQQGYDATGIELSQAYYRIAKDRMTELGVYRAMSQLDSKI